MSLQITSTALPPPGAPSTVALPLPSPEFKRFLSAHGLEQERKAKTANLRDRTGSEEKGSSAGRHMHASLSEGALGLLLGFTESELVRWFSRAVSWSTRAEFREVSAIDLPPDIQVRNREEGSKGWAVRKWDHPGRWVFVDRVIPDRMNAVPDPDDPEGLMVLVDRYVRGWLPDHEARRDEFWVPGSRPYWQIPPSAIRPWGSFDWPGLPAWE